MLQQVTHKKVWNLSSNNRTTYFFLNQAILVQTFKTRKNTP